METSAVNLWSAAFACDEPFDWATCAVSPHMWNQITDANPDARRLVAQIEFGARRIYMALGTPIHNTTESASPLFLPNWCMAALGIDGVGEEGTVTWMTEEAFPSATRIVLRPHDSAFHTVDAKEELERALTRLGVLRQGDTILIPIEGLGGYEIAFDVMVTEPAEIVLAEGDEVVMEFDAALDAPPAEPLEPLESLEPEEPMLPPTGNVLGGVSRRMPDGRAWNPYRDA
jgi:hypothetical protein